MHFFMYLNASAQGSSGSRRGNISSKKRCNSAAMPNATSLFLQTSICHYRIAYLNESIVLSVLFIELLHGIIEQLDGNRCPEFQLFPTLQSLLGELIIGLICISRHLDCLFEAIHIEVRVHYLSLIHNLSKQLI